MKFERTNYEGQIFGTRQIVRNQCSPDELKKYYKTIPMHTQRYRMARCLRCGNEMPVDVRQLKKNPPQRCAFCSGINNKRLNNTGEQNTWVVNDDIAILNLTYQNQVISAYIDADDYKLAASRTWRVSKKKNKYYLVSGSKTKGTLEYLHHLIVHEDIPSCYEIDHIDGNSLNNRKNNLRIVSRLTNIQNAKARIDNQIGIRGICKTGNVYVVDFSFKPWRFYFKHWDNLRDAVYCRWYAEQYFDLHILENNPLAIHFLNASETYQNQMREYVTHVIENTAKAAV